LGGATLVFGVVGRRDSTIGVEVVDEAGLIAGSGRIVVVVVT